MPVKSLGEAVSECEVAGQRQPQNRAPEEKNTAGLGSGFQQGEP